jgi:hypothetical protein
MCHSELRSPWRIHLTAAGRNERAESAECVRFCPFVPPIKSLTFERLGPKCSSGAVSRALGCHQRALREQLHRRLIGVQSAGFDYLFVTYLSD